MQKRAVVIGGGIGGLASAALLAREGLAVTLLERAPRVGGKMRQVEVDGVSVDAGPTVVTMRWVFDRIFETLGTRLEDHLRLRPAEVLHRHAWLDGARLDLYPELDDTVEAIRAFSGDADAEGYRRFVDYARGIFEAVEEPFIESPKPSVLDLTRHYRGQGLKSVGRIDFSRTMWKALREYFRDPRLQQLFGRYATYYGSSPFQAPGTLNLIAHVESQGVWLVEGGIYELAQAFERVARGQGAEVRCGAEVARIQLEGGRVSGVTLESGEALPADVVVSNADTAALADGRLGDGLRKAVKAPGVQDRSLSAVTWCIKARTEGFPLVFHNVFFSDDYPAEFQQILQQGQLPGQPTVYICAQDRFDPSAPTPAGEERLLVLINAPPRGDDRPLSDKELNACEQRTFDLLQRCGLRIHARSEATVRTTPTDFDRLFPSSGGALYGPITHGWRASFKRPAARAKIKGLYLVGGSVHPGAGVPMVAQSGVIAADAVLADLASTSG